MILFSAKMNVLMMVRVVGREYESREEKGPRMDEKGRKDVGDGEL